MTALPDPCMVSETDDLELDVTALAHSVTIAASLPPSLTETGEVAAYTTGVRDAWEQLTGKRGAEAVALAERVTRAGQPVTAAVVPF